jgi:hypothetical protein
MRPSASEINTGFTILTTNFGRTAVGDKTVAMLMRAEEAPKTSDFPQLIMAARELALNLEPEAFDAESLVVETAARPSAPRTYGILDTRCFHDEIHGPIYQ